MIVIKIGGSLLTNKAVYRSVKIENLRRFAMQIKSVREPMVVVHGTGSFGKPQAQMYHYMDGLIAAEQYEVVAKVEGDLDKLRGHVMDCLRDFSLPVISINVASLFKANNQEIDALSLECIERLLKNGIFPVISGGFVPNINSGFTVCSSDYIAALLAVRLKVRMLIYATDREILTGSGAVERLSESDLRYDDWIQDADNDVSRGLRGKLEAGFMAANSGIDTFVINGNLSNCYLNLLQGTATGSTKLYPA